MVFVIFSFIGTEVIAVTAGEAKDPADSRSARDALDGRAADLFYLGAIAVLIAIVPWTADPARVRTSPPVRSCGCSA